MRADDPWTKDLRVVHSDSQIRVLTSGWMSSMLCCTAADSILLRKPVLKRGPDLPTQNKRPDQIICKKPNFHCFWSRC